MAASESSARSRELGAELRRCRIVARWTGKELAEQIGWSQSKVSRMENGERGMSEIHVAIFLTFCGVLRDELWELLELARLDNDEYWLQEHGERLPDQLRTLTFNETTAATIGSYEPGLVPGLLQTADYAHALFHWTGHQSANRIELLVQARMDRQALLRRIKPPLFAFFIHEHALRSQVGSEKIMRDQLNHLVVMANRPHIEIRVVPATVPYGIWGGMFMLMRYLNHRPLIYTDCLTTSLFLEQPKHIGTYQGVLDRLNMLALDAGESQAWIAQVARIQYRAEGQHDGEVAQEQP